MFWRKNKEKVWDIEDRRKFLINDARQGIEMYHQGAIKQLSLGDIRLGITNAIGSVQDATQLLLLLWRDKQDISKEIAILLKQYKFLLTAMDEHNVGPDIADIHVDWASIYLIFWMYGEPKETVFLTSEPDIPEYYSLVETYLDYVTVDKKPDSLGSLEFHTASTLVQKSFATYCDIIDHETVEALVIRAEKLWEKRIKSHEFSYLPTMLGKGNANLLYVDVYLAAALHKTNWQGESIHKWNNNWDS